jgi:hypothetical protein
MSLVLEDPPPTGRSLDVLFQISAARGKQERSFTEEGVGDQSIAHFLRQHIRLRLNKQASRLT